MTSIQPELWVDSPRAAVAFYEAAFGASVFHQVGEGDDIVAPRAFCCESRISLQSGRDRIYAPYAI